MPAILKKTVDAVEVHPLVLLSVVDHYDRVAKGSKKRAVGCILGYRTSKTSYAITNSFAVPFDEETMPPRTWFLDHNYLEDMFRMLRRVTAKEKIIGWYSTGPKIVNNDISIHDMFLKYTDEPIYCIIKVKNETDDIPAEAYTAYDIIKEDGRPDRKFAHINTTIVASEAEEVGVEHLLRDIQNPTLSTLTSEVGYKISGLNGLSMRLDTILNYLKKVLSGALPRNQDILQNLQLIFNLLPNLSAPDLQRALAVKNNDHSVNLYIASIIRSVLAIDQLIDNKIENRDRLILKEKMERKKEEDAKLAKKKAADDEKKKQEEKEKAAAEESKKMDED